MSSGHLKDRPGGAGSRDTGAVLAEAAGMLAAYDLRGAERVLSELLADPRRLAGATPDQRCRALLEWGWIHGATQRYDIARRSFEAAAAEAERLRPRNLLCEVLREYGVAARDEGDLAVADRLLARSEAVARDDGYDLDLGQALFFRATVAHLRASFAAARDLLRQAAEAAARCPAADETEQLRADICRERAVSARVVRDYDGARELLAEARARYQRIGRRVGVANTDRELGAIAANLGDHEGARQHYARAFSAFLRAGRRLGAAQAARRLGHLDLVAGAADRARLRLAKRRFTQAIRLGAGEPANAQATAVFQAQLARMEGDLDAAERFLDEAVRIIGQLGPGQAVARDLSQAALEYGRVARDRGDRAKAISFFRDALAALRAADDPGAASLVHYQLAFELIAAGEVGGALRHALASFELDDASGRSLHDPAERRSFFTEHRGSYGLAMHCTARAGDGRAALAVAVAARSEALAAFVRTGARLDPGLRSVVDEIALATAEAERRPAGEESAAGGRLEGLYARLEHQTSREMRQMVRGEPADLDEIIATLPAGGHALLLDVLEEDDTFCSRVWVSPGPRIRVDEVQLSGAVRHFLDSYHGRGDGAAWQPQEHLLASLGQAVLPPGLTAALADGTNPPLVISAGGVLGPVPVAAVRVNGRYLAEQAQIVLVPALALWAALRMRPVKPGRGTLAFIDPGLPGARSEEAALRAALPSVRRAGARELRAALAGPSGYAMVVISAHGVLPGPGPGPHSRPSSLAQGLALADGDHLTAAELLTCHLPEALVTPSCWSARLTVRAATEPLGLPTAALVAGARWVLAGMVDISGMVTASLMRDFYGKLAAGSTPAAALQAAQARFLARPGSPAPPGAWAGLAIVGDGFAGTGTRAA